MSGHYLPESVGSLKGLSMPQKLILSIIIRFQEEKDGCFASNQYFTDNIGISERTVSRAVTRLKQLGCIDPPESNGRYRKIVISDAFKNNPQETIDNGRQNGEAESPKCLPRVDSMSTLGRQNVYADSTHCLPRVDNVSTPSYKGIKKRIKREEEENKKRILLPTADASADNPILTYPDKLQNTKKEKSLPPQKEEPILHTQCRDIYLDLYPGYYWTAKDAGILKQLIAKVKHSYKSVGRSPTDEDTATAFKAICCNLTTWMKENGRTTISDINSQYTSITTSIRNGKQPSKTGNKPHYQQHHDKLGEFEKRLGAVIRGEA